MNVYVTTLFVYSQPGASMLLLACRKRLFSQLHDKLPTSFFAAPKNCMSRSRSSEAALRQINLEVDLAYELVQQFARDSAHTHRRAPRCLAAQSSKQQASRTPGQGSLGSRKTKMR
jgi:hypothetical protein